jgi:hypothetical protein
MAEAGRRLGVTIASFRDRFDDSRTSNIEAVEPEPYVKFINILETTLPPRPGPVGAGPA